MMITKDDLTQFFTLITDTSVLTSLMFFQTFLDEIFKVEVKIDDNTTRKLTAEEMIYALKQSIDMAVKELKKDTKHNETLN